MKSFNVRQFLADNSTLLALVILIIIAVALRGTMFLSVNNIVNILLNNAIVGIIALGMTLVIISGGIDLSVGSKLALTGLVSISIMNATGNIVLGMLAAMATGVALGAVTGTLVSKFSIPAFIVTLGMMRIFRSVAQHFYMGGGVLVGSEVSAFIQISNTRLWGVLPLPVIYWIVLCFVVDFIARRTAFGRHIYAVGSNERAANLSGINVKRVKTYVFMLSGFLVALASIVEASRLGSMNSSGSGGSYELEAIAAVVIGGTAMSGGKGRIIGTMYGTLILGIINNMMNLLGLPPFLQGAIQGSIVIIAVLLQRNVSKKEKAY